MKISHVCLCCCVAFMLLCVLLGMNVHPSVVHPATTAASQTVPATSNNAEGPLKLEVMMSIKENFMGMVALRATNISDKPIVIYDLGTVSSQASGYEYRSSNNYLYIVTPSGKKLIQTRPSGPQSPRELKPGESVVVDKWCGGYGFIFKESQPGIYKIYWTVGKQTSEPMLVFVDPNPVNRRVQYNPQYYLPSPTNTTQPAGPTTRPHDGP